MLNKMTRLTTVEMHPVILTEWYRIVAPDAKIWCTGDCRNWPRRDHNCPKETKDVDALVLGGETVFISVNASGYLKRVMCRHGEG
jgi:calcineurin-like phosphoesterase family protein